MMSKPLLTIVIPVYNRAHCMRRTFDSVVAQTLRPLRLIIVDNNSTDGSAEMAREWADAHRSPDFQIEILAETKRGAAAARNRGLSVVETPWVMFFDSDDTMAPTLTADVAATVAAHPDADIVGWDVERTGAGGPGNVSPFKLAGDIVWRQIIHCTLSTQHYACRTELFRRAGGWNDSLPVWNDFEAGLRLLLTGPRIVTLAHNSAGHPPVTVYHSPDSITARSDTPGMTQLAKERALDCCGHALRRAGRDDMLRWIDLRRAQLAAEYARSGAVGEGRRLIEEVVRRRGWWYRIIYLKHRIYPRGTYLMLRNRK